MSTFPHFNPLQGSRAGTPSYLGRNLFEVEHQQKTGLKDNMYPLHKANMQHGAKVSGCKPCMGNVKKCSPGDVHNPCPADQYK